MKTKICLLLLLFTNIIFAQAPASLQSEVKRLYTACHDIDITLLSDMLCSTDPEVYAKLDAYFLSEETKFRYVETNAKYNYGPIQTVEGKEYCHINFRNVVRITYFAPIDITTKQAELKAKFNAQSVVYNQSRNAFMVIYNAKLLAIQDNGWKFAFLDQTLPSVSEGCLTESAKKALGL